MVWMHAYREMIKNGKLANNYTAHNLLSDIRQRVAYEVILEYGVSARVGRTLEKSGASSLVFDVDAISQAAGRSRERALSELGAFHQTDEAAFIRMTLGGLRLMKQNGAFNDAIFTNYIKEDGRPYHLSNDRISWMPGLSSGRNTPSFPYDNKG